MQPMSVKAASDNTIDVVHRTHVVSRLVADHIDCIAERKYHATLSLPDHHQPPTSKDWSFLEAVKYCTIILIGEDSVLLRILNVADHLFARIANG